MIKYNLVCKNCKKSFDSWFASSEEYEKLKKSKYIDCLNCNSLNVEKNLMSPNVVNSRKEKLKIKERTKYLTIKNKIKEYQQFIKNNFEYDGENFAYKARSLHYEKKNKKKNIYGVATSKEIKELKEEGINTEMIPWINENDN